MIVSPSQIAAAGGVLDAAGPAGPMEKPIDHFVKLALLNMIPDRVGGERRRTTRHPFPYPVYLTPFAANEIPVVEDTVAVIGRYLSFLGLDFYHRDPIPYRRAILSLPCGADGWVGLVMDLTWCRFNKHGWYDGGGHFLRAVASPLQRKRY